MAFIKCCLKTDEKSQDYIGQKIETGKLLIEFILFKHNKIELNVDYSISQIIATA